ncbi:hypothetical protein HCN08_31955, partial [Streptomyces sp. PRB2-1]|nr:hypothetical protein [Actinacidiphila epipremni]
MTSQVSSPMPTGTAQETPVAVDVLGEQRTPAKETKRLDRVIIRFAGDSGD